jgi:outer membrane protein assembly factor BamB
LITKWGLIALLLFIAIGTSGCRGAARATTWTELVISDDTVYVADLSQVRALDAEAGTQRWSYPSEAGAIGPFYSVTLLPGEALYVTSEEKLSGGFFAQPQGLLRALSIEVGEPDGRRELWRFSEAEGDYVSGGAVANDILVIGNGDSNLYALDAQIGSVLWTFPTENRIWARPLVLEDTVFVASLDHNLYALDLETGRPRWEQPFEAEGAIAAPPFALDGILYVGAFDSRLYALDQETGREVWSEPFEGANWFWGTPTSDGTSVYAADVDGFIYALDAEDGSLRWEQYIDELIHLGPMLSEDGNMLIVAGNDGTIYGLDTSDGVILWEKPGDGQIGSMVVDGEYVFVSRILAEETVQAFFTENGRNLWTFSPDS